MKKFYYPGEKFPSISVTGDSCSLSCPHCDGRFIDSMKHISEPRELYRLALELDDSGGNGFLLSGGCDERGKVPIANFFGTLKKIKNSTSLQVNVHTGLPDQEVIEGLIDTGIDIVSYDMIGSKETIKKIYGIEASPKDYKKGYDRLREQGLTVVPHITVGLDGGELNGEFKAVEMSDKPERMILNSLIPLDFGKRVTEGDFFSVMDNVDQQTEITLGCMREKGRDQLEIKALKKGAEGIVMPSKKTEEWAEKNYEIKRIERCCGV